MKSVSAASYSPARETRRRPLSILIEVKADGPVGRVARASSSPTMAWTAAVMAGMSGEVVEEDEEGGTVNILELPMSLMR